jgi:hypothetical protein
LDETLPDEVTFALKVLKYSENIGPKILILITSLLTWSKIFDDQNYKEKVFLDTDFEMRRAHS